MGTKIKKIRKMFSGKINESFLIDKMNIECELKEKVLTELIFTDEPLKEDILVDEPLKETVFPD